MSYQDAQKTARSLTDVPELYYALVYYLTQGDGIQGAWWRALRLLGR
jgi:hypothetical protein